MVSLLDRLRGDSKSLRFRFVTRPWLWLRYWLPARLAGTSEVAIWARLTDEGQAGHVHTVPDPAYLEGGAAQYRYLLAAGVHPEHRLLDYGCGPMRGGLHLARYLRPGNYVAADISANMLRRGVFLLTQAGVSRNTFHVIRVRSPRLEELEGFSFEWIFSHSALQYVSDTDFETILRALRGLLAEDGQLHFTFPDERELPALRAKRQYYRPPERLRELCTAVGFSFQLASGKAAEAWPGVNIAVLRRAS